MSEERMGRVASCDSPRGAVECASRRGRIEIDNHHFDSGVWRDFRFRSDDVVIATYAKCGTTWMQQLVGQLLLGPCAKLEVATVSPWLDLRIPERKKRLALVEEQRHRRFLKTHLPVEALVFSPMAKYVCVMRDARDVVWSMHNHHRRANGLWYHLLNDTPGRVGPPIEAPPHSVVEYWHDWLSRDGFPFWPFWSYVRSWWNVRARSNVLMIHFAEMKNDFRGVGERVAKFLDLSIEESRWAEIERLCSFDWMKTHGSGAVPLGGAFWPRGSRDFVFKGVNGRWRDLLSKDEVAKYEARALLELGEQAAMWLKLGNRSVLNEM